MLAPLQYMLTYPVFDRSACIVKERAAQGGDAQVLAAQHVTVVVPSYLSSSMMRCCVTESVLHVDICLVTVAVAADAAVEEDSLWECSFCGVDCSSSEVDWAYAGSMDLQEANSSLQQVRRRIMQWSTHLYKRDIASVCCTPQLNVNLLHVS